MRILITGATGLVGKRLLKRLSKKHNIIAVSRKKGKIRGAKKIIVADITNPSDLIPLKDEQFDVVYHLAAELDENSHSVWDTNVEGTRNLLEICKEKDIQRFIFLSSIGVLGEAKHPLVEDDPYNPQTMYEKSKAEAERIIMDYRLRYQIPYTIIRSTIICGPNAFWKEIFGAAKRETPIIGSGKNYWHLVYVDDVVDALVLAMQPQAKNQIYHVAGPDVHTYEETYKIIRKVLHLRFKPKRIPVALAKAAAIAHETKSKISGERPSITKMRSSIQRLVRNRIIDISKAKKELGFNPKYNLEKALEKTAKELGEVK
ncbi:MAG: NAD(P)-dependent oxidoreductase [Candidatus Diapherotrites archaeon]|nr:NAD(P)-dependent oxidoreductase [Candidatus Diapherotrites archaeon]